MLAFALAHVESSRMPQVAKGGGALSVAFADAKATISAAMVQKADSYFHGGIDIECHESREHSHEQCHGQCCEHSYEHCHGSHEHSHNPPPPRSGAADPSTHQSAAFDPWRWINHHVRAPEKHVHLDGDKAVELMPWFWAAVRADPHNIDAWTTAWYTADAMLKDRELARRILDEAKARNPDSLEIAWTEARVAYDGCKGDVAAAELLLNSARELGRRKCGGRLADLTERDARTYCYILDYLSAIYDKRGEREAIRPLVDEARATGADTPVIEWMRQRLH
jgi:hypothetical protein